MATNAEVDQIFLKICFLIISSWMQGTVFVRSTAPRFWTKLMNDEIILQYELRQSYRSMGIGMGRACDPQFTAGLKLAFVLQTLYIKQVIYFQGALPKWGPYYTLSVRPSVRLSETVQQTVTVREYNNLHRINRILLS